MKILMGLCGVLLALGSVFAWAEENNDSPDACVTVEKVERGKNCGEPDSVKLHLRNDCGRDIEVKFCMERKAGNWGCGVTKLVAGKVYSSGAWVCKGTGRYTLFGRVPGSTASFPGDGGTFRKDNERMYSVAEGESQESACKRAQASADGGANCACEPLKEHFRCRVAMANTSPEQLAKARSFRPEEFTPTQSQDGKTPLKGEALSIAPGPTRDAACADARGVANDLSAVCNCQDKGRVWVCYVSTFEPIPQGFIPELRRKAAEEARESCLQNPEKCKRSKNASWGRRD